MTFDTEEFGVDPWAPCQWIEPRNDGSWEPSDQRVGKQALGLPVFDIDHEIIDIVAWSIKDETRWWLRHRIATHLGARYLAGMADTGARAMLATTPASWLRLRGMACCLLDWTDAPLDFLGPVAGLDFETPEIEAAFRKTLDERWQHARLRAILS